MSDLVGEEQSRRESGVFLLNAGFSVIFTVSGLLFRAAAEKPPAT